MIFANRNNSIPINPDKEMVNICKPESEARNKAPYFSIAVTNLLSVVCTIELSWAISPKAAKVAT